MVTPWSILRSSILSNDYIQYNNNYYTNRLATIPKYTMLSLSKQYLVNLILLLLLAHYILVMLLTKDLVRGFNTIKHVAKTA